MVIGPKSYMGVVTPHGVQVRVREGTKEEILDLRLGLVKRSPEEWMDPETGPEQLALAILADATGDDAYAQARCKAFKEDFTWQLPIGGGWRIPFGEVKAWVTTHPLPPDDR
jgi:hypothetical protein